MTIRLAAAAGRPEVSAWVRYHSGEPLGKDARAGLNRLTGRQLAALRASLPGPATRPPLVVPARALRDDEQDAGRPGGGPRLRRRLGATGLCIPMMHLSQKIHTIRYK
jgi:hypothetical protein